MSTAPADFYVEGSESWQELNRVSDATHAARVGVSDFCGAWVALWSRLAAEHGAALGAESARTRARKGKPGGTREQILEKVRSAYMALMGAACKADKHRPRVRRFRASAWQLECARRGAFYDFAGMAKEDADRLKANLSRYWREAWSYVFMFQRVTGLAFVEREARSFDANARDAVAASYTERLADLIGEIIADKRRRRASRFRVEKFEQAAAAVLKAFRVELEHRCEERETCQRPHTFAHQHDQEPTGTPGRGAGVEPPDEMPRTTRRAKVISFDRGKKKLLEAVEIVTARAERGLLTPEQADEFISLLAPVVEIAERARAKSSDDDGVSSEDSCADEFGEAVEASPDESYDFRAENARFQKAPADKIIRVESPADFLAPFFPDPYEDINLRAFGPKDAPPEPRFSALKWRTCREALECDPALLAELAEANRTRGIYFVVNSGGDTDAEITRFNAFFAEMDAGTLAEQHAKFDGAPLPPGVRNETLKSVHGFNLAAPGVAVEEWREVQRRLIHFYGSDPKIKNPSRVMRLPGFNHVAYAAGLLSYKPVAVARFDPSRRYTAAEMLAAFPEAPNARPRREPRRATLDELWGGFGAWKRELGRRLMEHGSARRNTQGKWDCRGICHNGKGDTGLFYDPADNFICCNAEPRCDINAIAAAFGMGPCRGDAA